MMNACSSEDLEDIEDLMLPDNTDVQQNRKYVLSRAVKHKILTVKQTCADSVIPGILTFIVI